MNPRTMPTSPDTTPTTTPTLAVNMPWLNWRQTLNLLQMEAKLDLLTLWRTPGFVAPSLIFPVMFYLLFGVFITKGGQSDYLLVTYCCFGVMGPALFNFGVNVATEKSQGWLTMKQIAPAPVSAYLFGKVVSSLLFALVIVMLLFVCAALFGNVRLYTSQWLGLAGLVLVGTLPFCLFGLWLGLTLSAKAAPAVVNLIYLPLAFLGGLWLPIHILPGFMQQFAQLLPSFHFGQLALSVIGRDLPQPWWQHLFALLIFTVVFGVLASRAFRQNRSV
ncbi:ABC transporter permease [Rheinheimera riviphila]|nr:ABC transporter permease [Rheinheimera riviphila]